MDVPSQPDTRSTSTFKADVFTPLNWSMKEIKDAIPARLFVRSSARSMVYLARDLVLAAVLWKAASFIDPYFNRLEEVGILRRSLSEGLRWMAWVIYWWFQGLVFTGLWVIGHECGHGAFSSSRTLCDSIGFVLHTALWTPYFSWKISHHRHHSNHASMERDEVYVPSTRTELKIPSAPNSEIDWDEIFGDTPIYTLFLLIKQQLLAFPAYLLINVSGQKRYPRFTNHFDPNSIIFNKSQRRAVIISNCGILAMVLAIYLGCQKYGSAAVVKYYGIPWLAVTHWFIMWVQAVLKCKTPLKPTSGSRIYTILTPCFLTIGIQNGHFKGVQQLPSIGIILTALLQYDLLIMLKSDFLGWQGRFFLHDAADYSSDDGE
ncbi:unnamed protein product [Rhizoctonia solani]|uniref:Fatty acid desaturase domain-containing protein n=1 Tax=Rhizoctonia solani TaxID=456999 RepID=A0A8H3E838_9AGAM|nr:unnamed protein product [Rhizoctonia solani]